MVSWGICDDGLFLSELRRPESHGSTGQAYADIGIDFDELIAEPTRFKVCSFLEVR